MKTAFVFLFLLFSAACAASSVDSRKIDEKQDTAAANQNPPTATRFVKQPVLVELYTSEG